MRTAGKARISDRRAKRGSTENTLPGVWRLSRTGARHNDQGKAADRPANSPQYVRPAAQSPAAQQKCSVIGPGSAGAVTEDPFTQRGRLHTQAQDRLRGGRLAIGHQRRQDVRGSH